MSLRIEAVGRVLVVTMDQPEVRNALDRQTVQELRDFFDGIALRDALPLNSGAEPDIGPGGLFRPHAIVLAARGKVFCAGAHLGEMKTMGEADYQENLASAMDLGAMFRSVRGCPVPVVARVQGPAFGGGVGLAAACDLVVAGPEARFAFSEVRLGIVPGVISPLVIDRIGLAAARAAFLTAEVIDAKAALAMGLVDRLAGPEDGGGDTLDALLAKTINSLLKAGAGALSMCKNLVDGAASLGYSRSGELTARMIAEARTRPEAQAALQAFFDHRPAPWVQDESWPGIPGQEGRS